LVTGILRLRERKCAGAAAGSHPLA